MKKLNKIGRFDRIFVTQTIFLELIHFANHGNGKEKRGRKTERNKQKGISNQSFGKTRCISLIE